jgi:hypothetical protein
MPCTVDQYTDYLIASTGPATATGLARLHQQAISHDQVTRLLANALLDSTDVWAKAKPLIAQSLSKPPLAAAVLIVDDSILAKPHTDLNPMVSIYWDHSQHCYVRGVNFLSLLYDNQHVTLPIAVEMIEKTTTRFNVQKGGYQPASEYTKNEYFQKMLRVAQQQVAYEYVLGDSWYASKENMKAILGLKRHFIFALESSRTVALSESERKQGHFQALDQVTFPDHTPLLVYLRALRQAVLVVKQVFTNKDGSQAARYLVSSDTGLDDEQITTLYQRRWKVEEYHKSLKQNLGMGASPTKSIDSQANHLFCSILAFIKLEALRIKLAVSQFRVKAQLYAVGLKAMHQHLLNITA